MFLSNRETRPRSRPVSLVIYLPAAAAGFTLVGRRGRKNTEGNKRVSSSDRPMKYDRVNLTPELVNPGHFNRPTTAHLFLVLLATIIEWREAAGERTLPRGLRVPRLSLVDSSLYFRENREIQ